MALVTRKALLADEAGQQVAEIVADASDCDTLQAIPQRRRAAAAPHLTQVNVQLSNKDKPEAAETSVPECIFCHQPLVQVEAINDIHERNVLRCSRGCKYPLVYHEDCSIEYMRRMRAKRWRQECMTCHVLIGGQMRHVLSLRGCLKLPNIWTIVFYLIILPIVCGFLAKLLWYAGAWAKFKSGSPEVPTAPASLWQFRFRCEVCANDEHGRPVCPKRSGLNDRYFRDWLLYSYFLQVNGCHVFLGLPLIVLYLVAERLWWAYKRFLAPHIYFWTHRYEAIREQ